VHVVELKTVTTAWAQMNLVSIHRLFWDYAPRDSA
jgi:hypothetical protein